MKKFVVKRVLLSIVILFFVSMIIYAIMRCMPSSFVEQQALTLSQRPGAKSYDEWVAQWFKEHGYTVEEVKEETEAVSEAPKTEAKPKGNAKK